MNKNFKILIESQNEGVKIAIAGTKHELMYALAHLSSTLLKESNLSEKDIKKAIEIGLTPKEELEKEMVQMKMELEKKLQELFGKIS
jgi:hypothetical protein